MISVPLPLDPPAGARCEVEVHLGVPCGRLIATELRDRGRHRLWRCRRHSEPGSVHLGMSMIDGLGPAKGREL